MPTLTRWYVRFSLVYFVAALLAGLLLAAAAHPGIRLVLRGLSPVYFHLFLVGWVTQLIFGVVYWMFPKHSAEKPRGDERIAWMVFWTLNIGLFLRILGEPLQAQSPSSISGGILVASAVLQWLAGVAFVLNTWGRVKER
jgi:heme/copper-type cytochrome/quinol oxidase subunit 1